MVYWRINVCNNSGNNVVNKMKGWIGLHCINDPERLVFIQIKYITQVHETSEGTIISFIGSLLNNIVVKESVEDIMYQINRME